MIQRGIGITIGAIVSFILLILLVTEGMDYLQDFVIALVIGGVAAFFWPVVVGIWMGRRAKQRRDAQIESEVQRQLDQERRHQG
jgi:hypothetical protein